MTALYQNTLIVNGQTWYLTFDRKGKPVFTVKE